ncbi:hypothetical protein QBC38DRAFT_452208 [Podospora fimiseda]|uniref:Extracellular serine-rich protein n=1 Tax=Podospora fimiseda TaxID=252190 RepID=A0AAN7BWH0_9PEZI|nr:hypothetical protein QBC38DRAFT_452208 [Podospora fimiseda]
MLFTYPLGLVAVLAIGGAMAQTLSPSPTIRPSQTSTSSAAARTITINVGREEHVFNPKETTANVGDIIQFNFYPGGHGVARAEFEHPCIPYEYANPNPGFWSGFFRPPAITNPPPNYQVRVNDTDPIFYYCAAPHSCTDYQMIGVINPNATHTFEAQLAAAKVAGYQLEPGQPFPSESPKPRPSETGSPSSGGNNNNDNNGDNKPGGSSLSPGAIAGIAIGGVVVLVLAAALLYLCGRRGGFDKAYRKSALPFANNPVQGGPQMAEGAAYPVSANPKSPGQSTLSAFPAHDPYHGGAPFFGTSLPPAGYHAVSPNMQPGYLSHQHTGYSDVHSQTYHSAHASPQPPYQMAFEAPATALAPVELPSMEVPPNPAHSPPPQYSHNAKA